MQWRTGPQPSAYFECRPALPMCFLTPGSVTIAWRICSRQLQLSNAALVQRRWKSQFQRPWSVGLYDAAGALAPVYVNGVMIAGQKGVPRGLVQNYWPTLQPRIGFAYDIFGDGKTVLRGGTGLFFERIQGNDVYNVAPNAPFRATRPA